MCGTTLRICLEPSLRASNNYNKKVTITGSLALSYSQGDRLVYGGLCIIDAPDNNVEQILLRSVAYWGLCSYISREAQLWKFAWARSLPILIVCPVDKIMQGMWNNFL